MPSTQAYTSTIRPTQEYEVTETLGGFTNSLKRTSDFLCFRGKKTEFLKPTQSLGAMIKIKLISFEKGMFSIYRVDGCGLKQRRDHSLKFHHFSIEFLSFSL